MKKWIFAVSIALVAMFAMVGCGGGDDNGGGPTPPPPSTTWTVTFDTDGGTWTGPATKDITKGTTITQNWMPTVPDPEKQGYVFEGWFVAGVTPETAALNYQVDSDITLKAKWAAYNPATDAEITFKYGYTGAPNNGIFINAVIAGAKTTAAALGANFPSTVPTRDGYLFSKWVLEGATPEVTVLSTAPTFNEDASVIAIWVEAVTITFNYNYVGSPDPITRTIESGTTITNWPANPGRDGYAFNGWWNLAGSTQYTSTDQFIDDITLYAKWAADVLTGDDAFELLYLTDGAYAIYQFDIPQDKTLADYEKLSFEFKLSAAGFAVWNEHGLRGYRLYGVFGPDATVSHGGNAEFDLPDVTFLNSNTYNDDAYIIVRPSDAATTNLKNSLEADTWKLVEHEFGGATNANKPGSQTGTVYFALGISCQSTENGKDRSKTFVQLIKDIKLIPVNVAIDEPVMAQKPAPEYAQFLAYNNPIVFEWRGEPTDYNLEHWQELVPAVPEDTFNRGEVPEDSELTEVELGDYTYINKGNPTQQNGWVSFTEAGRANDQAYSGDASTIAFSNFIEAWYLVLETTDKPIGGLRLAWTGDAGAWFENTFTNGEENDSVSITPDDVDDPTAYTIKILLPKALSQYGKYYQENEEWVGLSLGYWGSGGGNLGDLGITRAYLLVATEDVAPDASGIALELEFALGTAPAGGAVIDDVVLVGTTLTVTTRGSDLSDFRWYIDGELDSETGATLNVSDVAVDDNLTITVQAKRDGKWVSQAVNISVTN